MGMGWIIATVCALSAEASANPVSSHNWSRRVMTPCLSGCWRHSESLCMAGVPVTVIITAECTWMWWLGFTGPAT
jgi:hypothetical protein